MLLDLIWTIFEYDETMRLAWTYMRPFMFWNWTMDLGLWTLDLNSFLITLININHKYNTLLSTIPCLSHSTPLRSCYCYMNGPCLIATLGGHPIVNNFAQYDHLVYLLMLSGDNTEIYIGVRIINSQ